MVASHAVDGGGRLHDHPPGLPTRPEQRFPPPSASGSGAGQPGPSQRRPARGRDRSRTLLHRIPAIGQAFDPPALRKARLAESVEILRRLLDGESGPTRGRTTSSTTSAPFDPGRTTCRSLSGSTGNRPSPTPPASRHHRPHDARTTLNDGQHHQVRWEPKGSTPRWPTSASRPAIAGSSWSQCSGPGRRHDENGRTAGEAQAKRARGALSVDDAPARRFWFSACTMRLLNTSWPVGIAGASHISVFETSELRSRHHTATRPAEQLRLGPIGAGRAGMFLIGSRPVQDWHPCRRFGHKKGDTYVSHDEAEEWPRPLARGSLRSRLD